MNIASLLSNLSFSYSKFYSLNAPPHQSTIVKLNYTRKIISSSIVTLKGFNHQELFIIYNPLKPKIMVHFITLYELNLHIFYLIYIKYAFKYNIFLYYYYYYYLSHRPCPIIYALSWLHLIVQNKHYIDILVEILIPPLPF